MAKYDLKLKRVTLTEEGFTAIAFDSNSGEYLVKNFSSGDIFVAFSANATEDTAIKIATGHGQVCLINKEGGNRGQIKTKTVYIKGSGEVEVQQLWY